MQLQANDSQINYELSGPESAPVIVLSHSLACNYYMWDPQLEPLQQQFRVLRYDTRGHGGSSATPEPYSLDLLGDDAIALLDALELDKVHWVGLSMGGMIGQNLALRYADRLQSLSLCDTMAQLPAEAQPLWQSRIDQARDGDMSQLVDETLARWFTAPYLDADPAPVKLIRQYILSTSVTGYIGCCEAIRGLDYLDQLSTITLPTLIIVGDQDPSTPPAAAEAMRQRIAGSQLITIADAAHLSNIEQAAAFNQALLEFLSEQIST